MSEDSEDFLKVYCDVCEQKIYLEEFPADFYELSQDKQREYLHRIVKEYGGRDSLASWNRGEGGPVEEWVTICKGCGTVEEPTPKPRVRILAGWVMPIWVDPNTKNIIVDWYGKEVRVGKAEFSEEADTWMFAPEEHADFRSVKAPESRFNLQDELDEGLAERLDAIINENMGDWFKE